MKALINFFLITFLAANVTNAAITDRDKAELGVVQNYETNGGCESGTAGFKAFNTTFSSGIPTTITLGSNKLSVASVTTNVLQGAASCQLNVTTSSASTGHGIITDPITIKDADLAKNLAVYFDYNFVAGQTNVDVSGTSTQTVEVWVYNVGLATWYQPAGYRSINTKGTSTQFVPGKTPAITFQSDVSNASSKNQYRIAWIIRNDPTGTFQMNFDNVTFGRQKKAYGPVITDWGPYTPTFQGFGTVTSVTFFSRRNGDSLETQGRWTNGSTSGSQAQITLGYQGGNANVTIDSTKVPSSRVLGDVIQNQNLAGAIYVIGTGGNNYMQFGVTSSGSGPQDGPVNGNSLFTGSAVQSLWMRVPISGWSSNTQLSNDTDTREVSARYVGSPATGTLTTSDNIQKFSTVSYDTHGAYDVSSGLYTVAVTGKYKIEAQIAVSAASASTAATVVQIYRNGTKVVGKLYRDSLTVSSSYSVSSELSLNAGDTIGIYAYCEKGTAVHPTPDTNASEYFTIERLSGPSVIAANDTVASRYTSTAGQSFPNNSATIYDFGSKEYDLTNSVTTGASWKFTAPVSGKYSTKVGININSGAAGFRELQLFKNGSFYAALFSESGVTASVSMVGATDVPMLAGDTVDVRIYQASGGSLSTATAAGYNFISIVKVGD